ncbi:MAG: DUF2892 domain-containing protein [Bacteriovoracaceae bacterium]|jgi:hypothetical protein|nr:DUF2892 domain-containing protein [Bacteriovoracaceae bacterium]
MNNEKNCTVSSTPLEILLRRIAGSFIIIAALLTIAHSTKWIYFIIFIGANLLQSSFTNWCPMMTILRKVFKVKG